MTLEQRIDSYCKVTQYPRSIFVDPTDRICGTWIMGNAYMVTSTYYGGYPAGYLRRVAGLFPDKKKTLHLFSGMVDTKVMPGDTVDINPHLGATYVDDAQTLKHVPLGKYDLVVCDPPYSVEDAEHYQTSMIKRNVVMKSLQRCKVGTHVVWLDQVLPMYRKDHFRIVMCIGLLKSTNHRFRMMTVFERVNPVA